MDPSPCETTVECSAEDILPCGVGSWAHARPPSPVVAGERGGEGMEEQWSVDSTSTLMEVSAGGGITYLCPMQSLTEINEDPSGKRLPSIL